MRRTTTAQAAAWKAAIAAPAGGTSIQVVNDGELLGLSLPLNYRIHPNELAVLMPALQEPAEAPAAIQGMKP